MRWISVLVMGSLSLPCYAQDASIEIGGVEIRRGMKREDIELALPAPNQIDCLESEEADGVQDDTEACQIGNGSSLAMHGGTAKFGGEGGIVFKDGRVWSAHRNRRISDSSEAYEMFLVLNELLAELTGKNENVRHGLHLQESVHRPHHPRLA